MSDLPSGLASISSRLDDSPNARGAVAFGRMVRERQEARAETVTLTIDQMPSCVHSPVRWHLGGCRDLHTDPKLLADMREAIDRHAALVLGSAYRSADRR